MYLALVMRNSLPVCSQIDFRRKLDSQEYGGGSLRLLADFGAQHRQRALYVVGILDSDFLAMFSLYTRRYVHVRLVAEISCRACSR